jgi:hypothetical protein
LDWRAGDACKEEAERVIMEDKGIAKGGGRDKAVGIHRVFFGRECFVACRTGVPYARGCGL